MTQKKPYDAFSIHGGRLTSQQMQEYINRIPLQPDEREYVKRVMERFDQAYEPWANKYITREEFQKGLDEMAKNPSDPITPKEAEWVKKHF